MGRQGSVVRFVVGSPNDRRAATWRCWTPGGGKNDVYLGPRSVAGAIKLSFHESGSWHWAFDASFKSRMQEEGRWTGATRLVRQWDRPEPQAPGCNLAFRVIVPAGAVTMEADPSALPQDLVWIGPPPEGRAVEVSLFFLAPDAKVTGWPGKRGMGTELVGSMSLPNGETAWLVHRVDKIPSLEAKRMAQSHFTADPAFKKPLVDKRIVVLVEVDGAPAALMETLLIDDRDPTQVSA